MIDLPILLLVLAVTAVFITSIYHAHVPLSDEREAMGLNEECIYLKNKLQNFEDIQADEKPVGFSLESLERLEEEKVESFIGYRSDHEYWILIEKYDGEFEKSFGSQPPGENEDRDLTVSTYTTPISLVDQQGVSQIGRLEVKVWGS